MAIVLNDNIKINAGKPSEAKYLNPNTNVPYTGTTQVNTLVPISERHRGLTVLIGDTEYWYKDGVANIDLILKSSGGSGERIEKKFTQSGHTFTFGNIIEYSGGTFQKALALSNRNAEVIGFVSEVPNANTFTVVMSGYVSGISGLTLSPSTTYYLSDVAAGGLTSVEPTDPNTISKPILTTITTNDAFVFQYRGFLNTTGVTGGGTMGLDPKESAHVATTGPLTGATYVATGGTNMSGAFTSAPSVLDGHALTVGDRILVKDQVDQKQNGLYYLVFGNTWYRTTDQDGTPAAEVSVGNYVFVTTGATYGGTGWVIIGTGDTITLNSDPIEWVQFNTSTSYTAGDGIDITGQLISVDPTIAGDGLTFTSGVLDVGVANGLSIIGNKVTLGGTLTGNTTIAGTGHNLTFNNNAWTFGSRVGSVGLNSVTFGFDNTASGVYSHAEGNNTSATGNSSHAEGTFTKAFGAYSHAGGYGTATKEVLALGQSSFNHSKSDGSQVVGHGALADYSAILGGINHNIPANSTGSVILGGDTIKVLSADINTVYLPKVRIGQGSNAALVSGSTSSDIIVRGIGGLLQTRTIGSLLTGITANNGLTKSGDNIRLGGTLTGDTIIDGSAGSYDIEFANIADFKVSSNNFDISNSSATIDVGGAGLIALNSDNLIANATNFNIDITGTGSIDSLADFSIQANAGSLGLSGNTVMIGSLSGFFAGAQYHADHSTYYTARSIPDVAFVTGLTPALNVYTQKVIITSNYSATTANHVIFCSGTSAITLTLPASPVDGQVYKIKDVNNAFLYNVTISGNGNTIDSSPTFTINTQRGGVEIVYDQTLDEWMVMNFVG